MVRISWLTLEAFLLFGSVVGLSEPKHPQEKLHEPGPTQKERKERYDCCKFSANAKSLWQTVLPLPPKRAEGECEWSYGEQRLVYTSRQSIVAGFHLDCLQIRGGSRGDRKHTLDMLFQIDAQTGEVLKKMEWNDVSTRRNWAGDLKILPSGNGRFLVLVGSSIKLFSPEFSELKSRPLTSGNAAPEENWTVSISSDGKTGFFTSQVRGSKQQEDHWFSADTLEDETAELAPPQESWRAVPTASAVFFRPFHSPPSDPKEVVHIRERGNEQIRPLCSECVGFPLAIVPDGLLLLTTVPKASFMLVTREGKIVHRASYGKPIDGVDLVTAASAAPRFALSFGHLQGRLSSFGSVDTVVVFDSWRMADVLQLKIEQQPEHYSNSNIKGQLWPGEAFALSPDGVRLAVLSGAVLKTFQIPR